jgi:hypothetical protein
MLRCGRDLVRLRQRVRQIAGLLGLDPSDQARVAATVFEMAWQTWRLRKRAVLRFQIEGEKLEARVVGSPYRLEQRLPADGPRLAPDDWSWVIEQLKQRTPLNLLEEIHLQNQEFLCLLHERRRGQLSTNPAA